MLNVISNYNIINQLQETLWIHPSYPTNHNRQPRKSLPNAGKPHRTGTSNHCILIDMPIPQRQVSKTVEGAR